MAAVSPDTSAPRLRPLVAALMAFGVYGSCLPLALAQYPRPSPSVQVTTSQEVLPIHMRANHLQGQPDIEARLRGNAEVVRGSTRIRAEAMDYLIPTDTLHAQGAVRIRHGGNDYWGDALTMQLQTHRGEFTGAGYDFPATGGHGQAALVQFLDSDRTTVHQATYTTCRPQDLPSWGAGPKQTDAATRTGTVTALSNGLHREPDLQPGWEPDWQLRAERIEIDRFNDVGIAHGAVLSFKGVPILPVPAMSFPLSDRRKSGLLPPTVGMDGTSGLQYAQPYYWNIAPNYDATLTPAIMSKRGVNLGAQMRYLHTHQEGEATLNLMPDDRLNSRSRRQRWSYHWLHTGRFDTALGRVDMRAQLRRVSDDDYWRDFSSGTVMGSIYGLTGTRLLESDLSLTWAQGGHSLLARAQKWQTLQDLQSPITPPFDRLPQLQWTYAAQTAQLLGLRWTMQADTTRFAARALDRQQHPDNGQRSYWQLRVSRAVQYAAAFFEPHVQLHASHYRFDARHTRGEQSKSFVVPTLSFDSGLVFERDTRVLGRDYVQTLEPRLFYSWTPYRDQSGVPLYDTALKDFNLASIFSENSYSGHDRIADNHMVTLGLSTRYLHAHTGEEVAHFTLAQRLRLRDQRNTLGHDTPGLKGWSDILLGANLRWHERWSTDALVQYNRDIGRVVRSSVSAHYQPGAHRALSLAYRYIRPATLEAAGLGSEQVDLGWQWPLTLGRASQPGRMASTGRWYGVGRLNYSMKESKLVDTIVGLEYDSCCWTGRVVVERLRNSVSQADTRLLLQLEFKGLSRLNFGANPLSRLQEYVPGYEPLSSTAPHVRARHPDEN